MICYSRLANKVKNEPLKSDFTIDLKHEVRKQALRVPLSTSDLLCLESDDQAACFSHSSQRPPTNLFAQKERGMKFFQPWSEIILFRRIVMVQHSGSYFYHWNAVREASMGFLLHKHSIRLIRLSLKNVVWLEMAWVQSKRFNYIWHCVFAIFKKQRWHG